MAGRGPARRLLAARLTSPCGPTVSGRVPEPALGSGLKHTTQLQLQTLAGIPGSPGIPALLGRCNTREVQRLPQKWVPRVPLWSGEGTRAGTGKR